MRRIIEWTVERPALANILMLFLLGVGGYIAYNTTRETMPEFSLDRIQVSVVYKGASAEEIEESVCIKIEEEIAGVEGVKKIVSNSAEGLGVVTVELRSGANTKKALDDVKNKIDQIDTFPKDIETPITVELTRKRPVIKVSVFGDVSEKVLTATAKKVRDDLMERPGISQVELAGDREYEVLVEIPEAALRKYGLTLAAVADLIKMNSLDLPGGIIESEQGKILLRTKGQLYTADEFKALPIISTPEGALLKLGELATVTDTFEDVDVRPRMNGKPCIVVNVDKTSDEDALDIAQSVKEYVEEKNRELPESVRLACWADDSVLIKSRLELLAKNGLQGLVLVFLILSLFLRLRLAFWVAMGIPVSVVGSFVFLGLTDFTINMITMFSFIVVLGVVVDDAIVIGENVHAKNEEGLEGEEAAVQGASELAYPVINSVATTVVAFAPMLFVAGAMGKLMKVFPVAIIAVLLVSLFEAFVILPSHLAHMKPKEDMSRKWSLFAVSERVRRRFDARLQRFIDSGLSSAAAAVIRQRYVFCSFAVAVFIFVVGLTASGRVQFVLFPKMDSDTLSARLTFREGANFKTTLAAVKELEDALKKLEDRYSSKDGGPVIRNVFSLAGEQVYGTEKGSHTAETHVELTPSEERGIPSYQLASAWRKLVGELPDALAVSYSTEIQGVPKPGGQPIEVQLMGDSFDELLAASWDLRNHLATFEGVYDIQDSYRPSKKEFRLGLQDGARHLGITLLDLARQIRANFWGEEALKVQRGRDEVTVRVRYPEKGKQEPGDLERMKIRTKDNHELPFSEVAKITEHSGPAVIDRIHRKRAITVSADLDEDKANAAEIVHTLQSGYFDKLKQAHPGVSILVEGQQKETEESMGSLKLGFVVAVLVIYVLLVNQFKTYTHPVVVMTAIPFSFVGVVAGHLLFDLDLTLFSMLGVLALAGIVVNDSLLLVHSTNEEIDKGASLEEALRLSVQGRFRQIVLTSLSTILGLLPILSETSFQAQFLKPMTVAVVFGLLASTILILLFVPALIVIRRDLLHALGYNE